MNLCLPRPGTSTTRFGRPRQSSFSLMTTKIILAPRPELQPAPLFTPTPKAATRVLEFFTAQINNDHTRKAYLNATRRFAAWWCAGHAQQLGDESPLPNLMEVKG